MSTPLIKSSKACTDGGTVSGSWKAVLAVAVCLCTPSE